MNKCQNNKTVGRQHRSFSLPVCTTGTVSQFSSTSVQWYQLYNNMSIQWYQLYNSISIQCTIISQHCGTSCKSVLQYSGAQLSCSDTILLDAVINNKIEDIIKCPVEKMVVLVFYNLCKPHRVHPTISTDLFILFADSPNPFLINLEFRSQTPRTCLIFLSVHIYRTDDTI